MEHVERIGRTLAYQGTILDIYKDRMVLPNGNQEDWDYVSHRMGAAAVVAVLEDGKILLVQQYRPALDRMTWEVPAGCRDDAREDYAVCAKRELREETGYDCERLERLISLKTIVAFGNEVVEVFLAKNCRKVGAQKLDDAEDINVKAWELEELEEKIYAGEIQDAKTVAAIMAYANRK
ncbi:NUDIX hydrolase [Eubacterium oxidoreducens]|uniref:ADP-ribose pyrophosphatase n=1 Tax=Eubacterium oxidoreducens TaxID=1732 RepID=A0A1G6BBV6_EUBOX|nr:NUDIX hydrolase [Eubacterium oxidoreducens]SDB18070.1 ADP-ribose pyrophosphatase [Eubacterium oxidoreducens]